MNKKLDEALGELLRASDPISKTVISAYRHDSNHNANVTNISAAKFNTEVLERCAEFLDLRTRKDDGTKLYANKRQIADKIVLKIESFFESTCDECKSSYRHHIGDDQKPLIACFLCLQGAHNCEMMRKKIEPMLALSEALPYGFVWVCHGCREKNDTHQSTSKINSTPDAEENDLAITPTYSSEDNSQATLSQNWESFFPAQNARQTNTQNDRQTNTSPNDQESIVRKSKTEICPLYKKAKCPHGLTGRKEINGQICKKDHPKRCIRFCRFGKTKKGGCTRGDQCQYFHPILCKYSVMNHQCTKEDCTFTHLKGTRRHAEPNAKEATPPVKQTKSYRNDTMNNAVPKYPPTDRDFPALRKQEDISIQKHQSRPEMRHAENTASFDNSFLEQTISRIIETKMQEMQMRFNVRPPLNLTPPPQFLMQAGRPNMFAQHSMC